MAFCHFQTHGGAALRRERNPSSTIETLRGRENPECAVRALTWHGKEGVRCERVPDPTIQEPRDAILKVTARAICGPDLHLSDGTMPFNGGRCFCLRRSAPVLEPVSWSLSRTALGRTHRAVLARRLDGGAFRPLSRPNFAPARPLPAAFNHSSIRLQRVASRGVRLTWGTIDREPALEMKVWCVPPGNSDDGFGNASKRLMS